MKTKIRNIYGFTREIEKFFKPENPFRNKITNRKIIDLLKNLNVVEKDMISSEDFKTLHYLSVFAYPKQRFGQIMINYFPDQEKLLSYVFPNNPDPFYEENRITINRLNSYL